MDMQVNQQNVVTNFAGKKMKKKPKPVQKSPMARVGAILAAARKPEKK